MLGYANICTDAIGVGFSNDRIGLKVDRGKIHGLLGENGAGKTTLMSILRGLYQPDGGHIYINRPVKISSPQKAIAREMGMIYQHFLLRYLWQKRSGHWEKPMG